MPNRPTLRFAPSPNGHLHLGHALSALVTYRMAQRLGGRFLLRIEDIDVTRCRPEFETSIKHDLTWLGITWDEPVLRQSEHFADYRGAGDRLAALGVTYPCYATRAELAAASNPSRTDPDGAPLYAGRDQVLDACDQAARAAKAIPHAIRIDMTKALALAASRFGHALITSRQQEGAGPPQTITANPARWGDAVILRKEVPASYHLAVVVDDARQGVTHVTRGQDLRAATDIQRLLQILLGLPEPAAYHHHRLITDSAGRKLSKSAGDTALRELRAQGVTPSQIHQQLGCD